MFEIKLFIKSLTFINKLLILIKHSAVLNVNWYYIYSYSTTPSHLQMTTEPLQSENITTHDRKQNVTNFSTKSTEHAENDRLFIFLAISLGILAPICGFFALSIYFRRRKTELFIFYLLIMFKYEFCIQRCLHVLQRSNVLKL